MSTDSRFSSCQIGVERGYYSLRDVLYESADCREASKQGLPSFVFSTAYYCAQPFLVRNAYLSRMESASRLLSPLYVKLDSLRTPCSTVPLVEGLACYTIRAPVH